MDNPVVCNTGLNIKLHSHTFFRRLHVESIYPSDVSQSVNSMVETSTRNVCEDFF